MIEVVDLSKAYGPIQALQDVSFQVKSGEIVGLLGPNGAGKSTTIKILTGYLQPDDGTVRIDNLDVLEHTREVQSRIGYLSETTPLYPELSVQDYLKMMADLREIPSDQQLARLSQAIYDTALEQHLTRPIGQLSKGYRQRVNLAQAILHQPKLLILDEPTVGLDPTQIIEIRNLIKRLAQNSTVLFSSHILSEVEAVCDRVIILMNGQIKADAYLSELSATTGAILVLDGQVDGVQAALKSLKGVQDLVVVPTSTGYATYHIVGDENVDLCPVIYDLARQKGWPVRELRPDIRTLESVFNQLATAA